MRTNENKKSEITDQSFAGLIIALVFIWLGTCFFIFVATKSLEEFVVFRTAICLFVPSILLACLMYFDHTQSKAGFKTVNFRDWAIIAWLVAILGGTFFVETPPQRIYKDKVFRSIEAQGFNEYEAKAIYDAAKTACVSTGESDCN